jgi:hypothetical protein
MADQSDVETALAAAVSNALYPNGAGQASVIAGAETCRIYRGWPASTALEADLAAGIVNVTIYPGTGAPRETTRYPAIWQVPLLITPTLTVAISGVAVTFAGATAAAQVAGVAVDGATYSYAVQATDTTASVAASLAAPLRAAGRIVQTSGATLSLPGAGRILARVVQSQSAIRETRRQRQEFKVICWCPTPTLRDQVAGAIDSALSGLYFLSLADGTGGRLTLGGGATSDQAETARMYRRDLVYLVDYPTTEASILPSMLFGTGTLGSAAGTIAPLLG